MRIKGVKIYRHVFVMNSFKICKFRRNKIYIPIGRFKCCQKPMLYLEINAKCRGQNFGNALSTVLLLTVPRRTKKGELQQRNRLGTISRKTPWDLRTGPFSVCFNVCGRAIIVMFVVSVCSGFRSPFSSLLTFALVFVITCVLL